MKSYKRAWCALWSAVAAVGFGLAVLQSSAIGVLLALGLLLVLCWLARQMLPAVTPGWPSLTVTVGILAVWAFYCVSPALGLLFVLTAGLSSPAVVGHAGRSAHRPPKAHAGGRAADRTIEKPDREVGDADYLTLPETMGPLNGLDDRQLCRLWRESFWLLREPTPTGTTLCLVALRGACLDELERRDASALHAWLDNGARASGGPEKYLSHPPGLDPGAG